MAIKPIIHDLEYDSNYVTSSLDAVDVTTHYAILLRSRDPDGIIELVEDEEELIQAMREIFESDHSLLDDGDQTRPWCAYGLDLVADLSKSMDLDPEDQEPVDLVARWLEDPVHEVNDARRKAANANALTRELSGIMAVFDVNQNPNLLITAFSTLLAGPGAFGALTCAIAECGPQDPTGALRASAELENRRS